MIPGFLLTLREGLEAALIISLVLGSLRKIGRPELNKFVWSGTLIAALLSALAALGLNILGTEFKDPFESTFEGLAMLLAAGILTWMIFWMQRQARFLKREIDTNVRATTLRNGGQGLFFISFLAVIREGLELALIFWLYGLLLLRCKPSRGALLGLAGAVGLGWLLFTSTHRFNLRRFFQVTNIILVIFAAGLVANSVHELTISGWIPVGIAQVWNINHILDDSSVLGQVLNTLVGYNSQPSLAEIVAYLGYIAVILGVFLLGRQRVPQKMAVAEQKQK